MPPITPAPLPTSPGQAPRRSDRLPDIDRQRCTGCGRCVAVCGPHLLSLEAVRWKKFALLSGPEACTGCSLCAVACPFHAITMRRPGSLPQSADPGSTPPG